jgi:hypothetical protein
MELSGSSERIMAPAKLKNSQEPFHVKAQSGDADDKYVVRQKWVGFFSASTG